MPFRAGKTPQKKDESCGSDSIRTVQALGGAGTILFDHVESVGKFNPIFQMPHVGVHFSSFVSWSFGTPDWPLSDIPFQTILDRVASGAYKAKPARVFRFEDIQQAHRLLETNEAGGKIVVRV